MLKSSCCAVVPDGALFGLVVAASPCAAALCWPGPSVSRRRVGERPRGRLAARLLGPYRARLGDRPRREAAAGRVARRHGLAARPGSGAGERVTVTVDVHRPGWIGWLVGRQEKRTMTVVTPAAHIRSTLLRPKRGSAVIGRFAEPSSRVAIGNGRLQSWAGRSVVPLGIRARRARDRGHDDGGGGGPALGDALGARLTSRGSSRLADERRRRAQRR